MYVFFLHNIYVLYTQKKNSKNPHDKAAGEEIKPPFHEFYLHSNPKLEMAALGTVSKMVMKNYDKRKRCSEGKR